MKKRLSLTLFLALLSCFGHFYLAKRAYQLEAGVAKDSKICSLKEGLSCDPALLSPYSRVFDISLSNFGLAFYLILSLLLFSFLIFGSHKIWKNYSFYLAGLMALASLPMAFISLNYKLFCPVCWGFIHSLF